MIDLLIKRPRVGLCRIRHYVYNENLLVIKQIWSNKYPPEKPNDHTWLEKVLLSAFLILRVLSFSNLGACLVPTDSECHKRSWPTVIDCYITIWVITLSILLCLNLTQWWIAAFAAYYRVADIVNYQLCFLLIDSQKPIWRPASLWRSLLLALINLYEIVAAYAIIYLSIGNIIENSPNGAPLGTPLRAFYYSLVTMATLGYGEFVPADDCSRGIVITQLVAEIVFVLAVIPALISNITTQLGCRK